MRLVWVPSTVPPLPHLLSLHVALVYLTLILAFSPGSPIAFPIKVDICHHVAIEKISVNETTIQNTFRSQVICWNFHSRRGPVQE